MYDVAPSPKFQDHVNDGPADMGTSMPTQAVDGSVNEADGGAGMVSFFVIVDVQLPFEIVSVTGCGPGLP
jgi:hypothetical protein